MAVVHIRDPVAIDPLFPMFGVARVATLDRVFTRRRIASAALGLVGADARSDHSARGRRGISAPTAADLVADHAADHGAEKCSTRGSTGSIGALVDAGL